MGTLAPAIVAAGHTATVIGLGDMDLEWEDRGVRCVTIQKSRLRYLAWWLNRKRILHRLEIEAQASGLDVVEVPDFQGMMPFAFPHCPVVVRLHLSQSAISAHKNETCSAVVRYCERRTLSIHKSWIGVSQYSIALTTATFGLTPGTSVVSYYPIDVPRTTTLRTNGTHSRKEGFILFAGTVSERKGAMRLAIACRPLLTKYPNLRVVVVGGVPKNEADLPNKMRAALGDSEQHRLSFTGRLPRESVLDLMRDASVFAFPTTLETFGIVVAEAMAVGCPVITSRISPLTEIVKHGITGLLISPEEPDELTGALECVISDEQLAQRLGTAGQECAGSRFSVAQSLSETLAFYSRLNKAT